MARARRSPLWLLRALGAALLLPGAAAAQDFEARGFALAPASPRAASESDLAAGAALYAEHCAQCHGDSGDGQGVMADLLHPRPRDFTRAIYKIRTTPQGDLPTDDDLFRIIARGMPGTSMPAWLGPLSESQIWQLVAHLETFSPDFADFPAERRFVIEGRPDPSAESIERGRQVYVAAECEKCHGASGRGNGPSAAELEDEWGFPIDPADLTRPWTLRGGGSAEDLFRTMTTGVNGTPMPSFSDAWGAEDLWHLANYLHHIGREPRWGEIVRAVKVDAVPDDPDAAEWGDAPLLDVRLAGQIIQEPRLFNPAVQSLSVQALFDDGVLALLVTWNDRVENDGGDERPIDRVAVFFPAQRLAEGKKPYFLSGDRQRPVDLWQWSHAGGAETFLARGMDQVTPRASPVTGRGRYRDGEYRVLFRRALRAPGDDAVDFAAGEMIPIAANLWDGQNGEDGKKREISRWYYLLLEPETPRTTWLWPAAVVLLAGGAEALGLRRLRRHWANQRAPGASGVRDAAAG